MELVAMWNGAHLGSYAVVGSHQLKATTEFSNFCTCDWSPIDFAPQSGPQLRGSGCQDESKTTCLLGDQDQYTR